MKRVHYAKPDFPADAFAGTAACYARHRPPYPQALLKHLLARAGVAGEERLLDLACGPGRVALALAASFREVWAVDLEPEMVQAGRQEAARRGLRNVVWKVGKAEDLAAPPASCALITIGDAFHRLDQRLVARRAMQWLRPAGCVAILGSDGLASGTEPWQRLVAEVVRRWTTRAAVASEASAKPQPGSGPAHNEAALRDTGFAEVASHSFAEPRDWTIPAIIGYLHSTSFCSKRALGARAAGFEADLKSALLAHEPSGRYRERARFGYTFGRKPA